MNRMNRRHALVAVLALGLALAPAAANAYEAEGVSVTVSAAAPALNAPTTLTVSGVNPGEAVTATITSLPATIAGESISIAGTKALTKTASDAGVAIFTATFAEAGTFTVVFTGENGRLIADNQVITVAANLPTTGGDKPGTLPVTGSEAVSLAIGAGVLVAAGAGAVVVTRRRKASSTN